jgi:BirA family biotin operon repressor/biotin-[acetyl-CoA-carboxylase] ligase
MRAVRLLAERGAPEGTHVLAQQQQAGRGRRGRAWQSNQAGVYMTLLLRPPPHAVLSGLPLVFGLAAYTAVVACCRAGGRPEVTAHLGLKWPNDLVARGRKLGGILVEAEALDTAEPWLLVGLGLNVAGTAGLALAPEVQPRYIGLMDLLAPALDAATPVPDLVERLYRATLAACHRRYASWCHRGLAPTLRAWRQHDALRGQVVQALGPEGLIRGIAAGVGPTGALRLTVDGKPVWVASGEVAAASDTVYAGLAPKD